ncbi:MAG: DUF1465 family protein [Rhodospirillaceae bacterium]|nr:DUF1465 family protein [Rhodospirillaceae bacterium]
MDEKIIDAAIQDTVALTEAARDYVIASQDHDFKDPMQRLTAIRQSSRLTNLLTNILSWLMWHKAAAVGEIGPDELAVKTQEFEAEGSLENDPTGLPEDLSALILRGNDLFARMRGIARSARQA